MAYEGAVCLLESKGFPGRVHFIAHAVRDIADRLPFALDPQQEGQRVQYEQQLDRIEKLWLKLDSISDSQELTPSSGTVAIDLRVAAMIDSLIQEHRIRRQRPSNSELLFRFLMRSEPSQQDVNERLVRDFKKSREWFMGLAHLRASETDTVEEDELQVRFRTFEGMLHSFVGSFFTAKKELDGILLQANALKTSVDEHQVDAAVPLLSSPQHEAYFFGALENPKWIKPLEQRGLFSYPPESEHVEGGGVRFPRWPASSYLSRMASSAPVEVAAIFSALKTDNASVIYDMVMAALKMPTETAIALVPAVCEAAREDRLWIAFRHASDLCARLAKAGDVRSTMTLSDALFSLKIDRMQKAANQRDNYWYKDGLEKVVPILSELSADAFLPKLCEWLKVSVDFDRHPDKETGFDYSWIWRPAIEEHEQNRDHYFASAMVRFVRSGFEHAIEQRRMSLSEALSILAHYSYTIYKRMSLYLVDKFGDQDQELLRQTILDRSIFDDFRLLHEYAMLVQHRLGFLTAEQRNEWFRWIDTGPDMSRFDEFIQEAYGRDATEQDRQQRIRYWQFEKLHPVREHLDGSRREFYESILAEDGEPLLAYFSSHSGTRWSGADSPMTVDDMASMPFEEVVHAVSIWRPDKPRFIGPDIEGLATTFGQFVATDAGALSAKALVLAEKPAIFIRRFIRQMSEAIKAGTQIDIAPVIGLCKWVVEQPVAEGMSPEQDPYASINENWQWTRDEISWFIEAVCEARIDGKPKYPLVLREQLWALLSKLCHDKTGPYAVHDTAKVDPRLYDYVTLGGGSPRDKAISAALEYARWVANHIKAFDGKRETVPGGLSALPEVQEMLEWQIAPHNRTPEALSVIGCYAGLLFWIDETWLATHADAIFNLDSIEQIPPKAEGWAAWNAYLVMVGPHIELYRVFKRQYAYAVGQLARVEPPRGDYESPMNKLGEHIVVLYGRGQLGLDDDGALLRRFLSDAKPRVRRYAMGYIGQILGNEGAIPSEFLERSMTMWDIYWADRGKSDAREEPDAFVFGTWFSSGKLPPAWSLDRLDDYTTVVPMPEPDHAVAERLAEIAHINTEKATRIIGRMIRNDREGWHTSGWKDSAKGILREGMASGGAARKEAEVIIDYLGRRGYTEFGDLLDDGTTPPGT